MKKVFLTLLLVGTISLASFAQTPIRLGGLLGYASDIKQPAVGPIAEFMLNENMAISPSVIFYFPKKEGNVKYSWYELNGNFNYYFVTQNTVYLYGLAGLNVTHFKSKVNGDNYYSNGELGINIGFGLNFNINEKIIPFTELKYVVGDYDHAAIWVGIKVNLH